ncbi:MAG TPA: hypothetical protein VGM75_04735 [Pseudonocardiaceae bacterium]
MSKDRAHLDDALALSRSALALAEWARDLAASADQEAQLLIADAVVTLAAQVTATATTVIDRCRPQGEHHP